MWRRTDTGFQGPGLEMIHHTSAHISPVRSFSYVAIPGANENRKCKPSWTAMILIFCDSWRKGEGEMGC